MITTVTLNAAIDKKYMVDEMLPGEVMRVRQMKSTPGGKGLNVARVAAALGEEVTATGFIGGHSGEHLIAMLAEYPIIPAFTRTAGETRSCVNIIDSRGMSTELLEPGPPVSPEGIAAFIKNYTGLAETSDIITISGSLPAGCPDELYSELILIARRMGVPVLLDTSGAPLARAIAARPTLIKPNADELKALAGTDDADISATLTSLHAGGIAYALNSRGKDGAVMACAEGYFTCPAPEVEVVNPVGCGDAMIAALAIGLRRALPPAELLRFAVSVASASAAHPDTGGLKLGDGGALPLHPA